MSTTRFATASSIVAITAVAAAGAVFPSPAFGQAVSDRALSDVKAETVGSCTTVTVNFNIRFQVLSSFPAKGRELHVRLRPLDGKTAGRSSESLRTPQSIPELRSIGYEGDNPAGPVLSLFFTRDMEFTVAPGDKLQTLNIRIAEPGSMACAAGFETDQAAPSTGQQQAIPDGLYVVNVLSLPREVGDLTPGQRQAVAGDVVYENQFERDSLRWHRLRVGFFKTKEEADAARLRLSRDFPEAWVVKVSVLERREGIASKLSVPSVQAPTATVTPRPVSLPPIPATVTPGPVSAPAAPATATPAQAGAPVLPAIVTATPGPASAGVGDAASTEAAGLIAEAEQAIQDGNLDRAVQLLTNAVQKPENSNTPRALELLGLTRERQGQGAHARVEYEEYLRRYPSGEGADRVRQRLAGLESTSPTGQPGSPLREASGLGGAAKWNWGLRGSFSQFYFRDQGRTSTLNTSSTLGTEVDNSVNVNQLLTSGDIMISGGDDRRQFQIRAAGSYTKNFGTSATVTTINNGNEVLTFRSRPGGGSKSLTALYLDYTENELNTQIRVGRQTRNSSGVLGRFDGALIGWQASPKVRINAVGGFPVLSSRQMFVLKERPFYGVSVDLGAKRSPIQTTLYWFDQRAEGGFIDRRSVGIETRFLNPRFNAYAMADYDVKFKQLNLALGSFTFNFPDGSNLSLTADYRRSPLLTTTNSLLGMRVATLDPLTGVPVYTLDTGGNVVQPLINPSGPNGLRPFFTDAEIYQLALDRTLIAKSVTVTYTRPITKKLQVSADFALTDTGGTPGLAQRFYTDPLGNLTVPPLLLFDTVEPLPITGKEYFYGLQLIGTDMFMSDDIFILSGRVADTSTAKIYTADFNARVPVTSNFRLSPRLRYGLRDSKVTTTVTNPGTYSQLQPTIRFNYYPVSHSEIEVELGGNFTNQTVWNGTGYDRINETGWVLTAGYRLDF